LFYFALMGIGPRALNVLPREHWTTSPLCPQSGVTCFKCILHMETVMGKVLIIAKF
jgi:hypothetical protein